MKNKIKQALVSAVAITFLLHAAGVLADTVVEKTVTEKSPGVTSTTTTVTTVPPAGTETTVREQTDFYALPNGTRAINFRTFDVNGDGVLSLDEIGRMLFKLYDTDGNEVIDNNEYERRAVLTVVPVEKNTVISYDFDGDGVADKVQATYENFLQRTQLSRFDRNLDGLSPHEFTGIDFMAADVNKDHAVDIKEWRGSYIARLDAANHKKARFNK